MRPVIEAGTFNPSTIQRKSKWFDEMQRRPGTKTGSADISRIPVNVGGDQYHVALAFKGHLRMVIIGGWGICCYQ